jgi:anti-anti-sigma factor
VERERDGHRWTGGGFFIDDLFHARRAGGPVYADRQLVVTRTAQPRGLRFAGEIDVSNADAVGQSLRVGFGDTGDAHLDLSRLSFCDISGIRALVEAALELGAGRCILLHGLPEQLQTVMRVTGWSELPSLRICSCGGRP